MKKIAEPLLLFAVPIMILTLGVSANRPITETEVATVYPTNTISPTLLPTHTPTPTPTSTPLPPPTRVPANTPRPPRSDDWALEIQPVGHEIDCSDSEVLNGYFFPDQGGWGSDFCVPGMITRDSQFYNPPDHFWGVMSSYPEGVMERMCELNGPCEGYKDGVALVSCAAVGRSVWLRPDGRGWSGPYLVVDCGAREHVYYHHVFLNLAVEVGYKTTQRWGFVRADYIEVSFNGPREGSSPSIGSWWVNYALRWEPFERGACGRERFDISDHICPEGSDVRFMEGDTLFDVQ